MAKSFSLDEYKDVAERITEFYDRFPEGSLTRLGEPQVKDVGGKVFVIYTALAFRSPDDPQPATGTAWEPFPGTTPYTRDSELMNAETAAWGRAIIAAGISSKKVASRQEVRNRQEAPAAPVAPKNAIPDEKANALLRDMKELSVKRQQLAAWLISVGAENVPSSGSLEPVIRALSSPQGDRLRTLVDEHFVSTQAAQQAAA